MPRVALLMFIASAGCGPPPPSVQPSRPLPWVNPARCVRPCTHPDEGHLVTTDARARPAAGPHRVDADARPWLEAFFDAAAGAGHDVALGDSFRSYATQAMVWERKLPELGIAARPGHSEHELGLGVDLGFQPDAEAWLHAHAWEHGFVLSYPDGAERMTGFRYEPWHFRWVGSDVARTLHEQPGTTLEELFEATPGLGESGDCSDCPRPESQSTCVGLTDAGTCEGAVMRWCFKGAANAIDCALIARSCRADLPRAVCVP